MGILLMTNTLRGPSEVWLRRMVDGLRDQITAFALDESLPVGCHGFNMSRKPKHLLKWLKKRRVTSVLVHYLTNAIRFQSDWERTHKPIWVHVHGWDITWQMRSHQGELLHPPDYIERVLALPKNVCFIANSNHSKEKLLSIGIASSRIWVNHLGVPTEPTSEKGEGCNILYLGRLIDCKGPCKTIRAFERASDQGLDGNLTIAGNGPIMPTCQFLIDESRYKNRIKLLGSVSAATGKELRARAHIFTAHNCTGPLSNQEEALGVSLLEAMAAGIPVVTGKSGGISEIVSSGEHGILFEPEDIEAHANALLRLSQDHSLRQTLGNQGRDHVQSNFSLKSSLARISTTMKCQRFP